MRALRMIFGNRRRRRQPPAPTPVEAIQMLMKKQGFLEYKVRSTLNFYHLFQLGLLITFDFPFHRAQVNNSI
jgi:hypothetical protein